MQKAANLADASTAQLRFGWFRELWDDGHAMHARVGSFQANDFGLHDVHGNVWEWCRDRYGPYDKNRAGDGLNEVRDAGLRVMRGGDFIRMALRCRSATRYMVPTELRFWTIGVRPAREIQKRP